MTAYETVIGVEVHAQLATRTKIFCGCSTTFGREPNTQVCPVCLGLPGALPVLNRRVLEFALRLGLACGSEIPAQNVFARKNYFYPDLPKGYQISQYDRPVCVGGSVEIEVDEERLSIPLVRIHLEEDAGKSVHKEGEDASLVDLNRAGVPLVEIVSEPSLRSPAQAGAYLESLRRLVRYLDICDGNMEQGSLRCDANVSLRPIGAGELGTKVELKNMNSISGVVAGLEHEIVRQTQVLDRGEAVEQETRSWDAERGVTVFMRGKEDAHDYRYFPDPDLLPVSILEEELEGTGRALPELPAARRHRFVESLGLPVYDADVLSESRELADYYEAVAASLGDAKSASNWMMSEVMRLLNERGEEIGEFPVSATDVAGLLSLVQDATISGKIAKEVFDEMVASGNTAGDIVEARGLEQISDAKQLTEAASRLLDEHADQVAEFHQGKEKVLGFFVGQLMKATQGRANPQLANQILRAALEARRP